MSENKSTAERILEGREDAKLQNDVTLENMQEFKRALNDVCNTPNGQLVFRTLIRAIEAFAPKSGRDAVALVESNAKKNVYFQFVRPFLEPETRHKLED